jgi:hypothetical protein
MSMQFSPEDIARIRDDARLLIRRADIHEESLEGLVRATDTEVIIAHTADPSLPDAVVQRLFAAVLPKPSPPDVVLTAVQSVANL